MPIVLDGTNGIDVSGDSIVGGVTTLAGNLTMAGRLKADGGIGGNAGIYEQSFSTSGSDNLDWKVLCTIVFGGAAYAGAVFDVIVQDPETNYGSAATMKTERYVASVARSQGTVNDTRLWRISGPSTAYLRGVRISDSEYQLQGKQSTNWRWTNFRIRIISSAGSSSTNYQMEPWNSLPVGGAGVATYAPSGGAYNNQERFVRATFSNGISFDGGTKWLDAYDNGAWTPTVTGWTSFQYSGNRTGSWVRIGKTLHLWGRVGGTGITPLATTFGITSLPMSIIAARSVGVIGLHGSLATTSQQPVPGLWATNTTTLALFRSGPTTGFTAMLGSTQGTTGFDLIFHVVCEV